MYNRAFNILNDMAVFSSVRTLPELEKPRLTSAFPCVNESDAFITLEIIGYF